MEAVYPYAKIAHILLVIIFLGYIFFDVVIFKSVCKKVDGGVAEKFKNAIGDKAIRIMPLTLFFIFMSGGMMMSFYLGSEKGWFDTTTQQFLVIKVVLAMIIILGVVFNLAFRLFGKKPLEFMQEYFHTFVLICGFIVVIFAKLMFLI